MAEPVVKALQHYNYPVLDVECCCPLCTTWREHRAEFDHWRMLTIDHNRVCMCWRCKKRRQAQQHFLAAASRRELFCELSYHAAIHKGSYGLYLMSWITWELQRNTETDGWWATHGQSVTLTYWLSKFQRSPFGRASAAVATSGATG